jgi:hypothetical protein
MTRYFLVQACRDSFILQHAFCRNLSFDFPMRTFRRLLVLLIIHLMPIIGADWLALQISVSFLVTSQLA